MNGLKSTHNLCDHLFLLIGANPLPNWVAVRLLMSDTGQAYLVCSPEGVDVARRLAKRLISQKYRQPEYIMVDDAANAAAIYRAVKSYAQKIIYGQVGLNYTGGTKAMAVHTYRALEQELPKGLPPLQFSYLDARTLSLRFDFDGQDEPAFVGLDPRVHLTIADLLSLHEEYNLKPINREPLAWPVVEALEKLHRTEAGYRAWRQWITRLQNDASLQAQPLAQWPEAMRPVAEALVQGGPLTITLKELCQRKLWPHSRISQPVQLASWLEGEWIESYVLGLLQRNQKITDW